jgi:hypothetical protein
VLRRLFPPQFDNRFEGRRSALWLLGLYLALKLVMSVRSVLDAAAVAAGPDRFPLDRYGEEASAVVLWLFALNAFGQFVPLLLGTAALLRYRAMVPFVFLLLLLEQVGRRVVTATYEIQRSFSAGGGLSITLALLAILVAGMVLSLIGRPGARDDSAESRVPGEGR